MKKQKEMEINNKIMEMPDQQWKERLILSEEIEKSLDTADGEVKTKKIEESDTKDA